MATDDKPDEKENEKEKKSAAARATAEASREKEITDLRNKTVELEKSKQSTESTLADITKRLDILTAPKPPAPEAKKGFLSGLLDVDSWFK